MSPCTESIDLGRIILTVDLKYLLLNLDSATIRLARRRLENINGWDALLLNVFDTWRHDFFSQALKVVGRVRSLSYFTSIGGALADVFLVPYSEFQKKGDATAALVGFVTAGGKAVMTVAEQTVHLSSRLFSGAQSAAEAAVRFISGQNGSTNAEAPSHTSAFANPPANAAEGAAQAVQSLVYELREARDHIIYVPLSEWESKGAAGIAKEAVRAVPLAVLKPVVGVTKGVSKLLIGLRSQLNARQRVMDMEKYRSPQRLRKDSKTE